MKSALPSVPEVLRESLVLIGGAILAALILQQLPQLRTWLTDNARGTSAGAGGCNCNDHI